MLSKATKSSDSGDSSAKETANSSVCKPYNSLLPIGNFDFNIAFKGIYYGTDGWTPRNTELEKMDKNLFRSYSTVAKQDDKETICLYFTAMRQGYLDVNLTPQDIEQFERFLAEIDRYDYYEKPEYQDKSLKLLKFLKYFNLRESFYRNPKASDLLYYFVRYFSEFEEFENDGYLTAKRFVFGKEVSSKLGFFYKDSDDPNPRVSTWLSELRKVANKSQNNQAALQWAEEKLKQTR